MRGRYRLFAMPGAMVELFGLQDLTDPAPRDDIAPRRPVAEDLLRPGPPERLDARPVGTRVNAPGNGPDRAGLNPRRPAPAPA